MECVAHCVHTRLVDRTWGGVVMGFWGRKRNGGCGKGCRGLEKIVFGGDGMGWEFRLIWVRDFGHAERSGNLKGIWVGRILGNYENRLVFGKGLGISRFLNIDGG